MLSRIILDNLTTLQPLFYQSTTPAFIHKFGDTMAGPAYLCSLRIGLVLTSFPVDEILLGFCVHGYVNYSTLQIEPQLA